MDIASTIHQNIIRLEKYLQKNKIEAYRILNQNYELPLAVDIYKDNAVIHVFEPVSAEELKKLETALAKIAKINFFFYKNRTKNKSLKLPAAMVNKEIGISEYGNKFLINLSDYLDTGLFLDHRETRKWIAGQSKDKTVLNTFAYTSSFSVYAANGGAVKTHSVDLSKTYCEWTKRNLALNNLSIEKNWVFKMDTREYFNYARRKKLSFDIIIIDPPTFSKNKGKSFSVQKDHPLLINEALALLNPHGFILFSNNFKEFRMEKTKIPHAKIKEITDLTPPDFANAGMQPHKCYLITV